MYMVRISWPKTEKVKFKLQFKLIAIHIGTTEESV